MKNLLMPESMAGGTLARWLKREGDRISAGEYIAELESDKAMMEIEAPYDAVLVKILIPEGGEGVSENTVLAVLEEQGP